MRPGWRTSELTFAGLAGVMIGEIASKHVETLGDGIMRGCACLALAWIAGKYAHARTEAKRGQ